jgi:hypothetical protein
MDAKNSITIVAGAGNVTTTNVQEGLCKAWCRFDGTSSGFQDSFNMGSLTDHGTGDHEVAYTNNMNNANHTVSYLIGHNGGGGMLRLGNRDIATTGHGMVGTNAAQSSAQDMNRSGSDVNGDLA